MSTQQTETALSVQMQSLSPEYAEIIVLGGVLQRSGYFKDVRDQAQAVTKILCGRELGFSPIVSMQGIHIIEGKPALSSNLMATLIKRSGKYDYRVKSWTHTECVLTFRERVNGAWEDLGESSFTMEDAKVAGVIRPGGSWAKFPKAMMFARALSQGLRVYCPDVSAAPVYSPEEMGAVVNEEGDVTELPKSARPVDRTDAAIPVAPPTQSASAGLAGPSPAEPPRDKVNDESKDAGGTLNFEAEPTIGEGEQKALHVQFRDALKGEAKKNADALLYEWLKKTGYVDAEGNGTSKTIPVTLFQEVKKDALKYARMVAA
jgi:hypothetical protein